MYERHISHYTIMSNSDYKEETIEDNASKRKVDDLLSKESVKLPKLDHPINPDNPNEIMPSTNWNLNEIKKHYILQDSRWSAIFEAVPCKPFEQGLDKPINPFRVICESILAQQISYKASKA